MRGLLGVVLLLWPFTSTAYELEGIFGASLVESSYQGVEDSEVSSFGMSMRARYLDYGGDNGKGWFWAGNFSGYNILAGHHVVGYGIRMGSKVLWEIGGGVAFSFLWGPGLAIMGGPTFKLGKNWQLSFPTIARGFFVEVTPYIGYRF